ncbi:MAG: hypothetical protein DMG48_14505 [Acidobacteria bacterium]|nr:MAG: hypothetical protein DMG48_14505 [Acidobacteriota bacterium]
MNRRNFMRHSLAAGVAASGAASRRWQGVRCGCSYGPRAQCCPCGETGSPACSLTTLGGFLVLAQTRWKAVDRPAFLTRVFRWRRRAGSVHRPTRGTTCPGVPTALCGVQAG